MTSKEKPLYDHVLVIGNGFDLSLGLKTSYVDFVQSNEFIQLESESNQIATHLRNKLNLQTWIDIEQEFPEMSKNNADRSREFFEEYKKLCGSLIRYLESIDYDPASESSESLLVVRKLLDSGSVCVINFNYTDTIGMFVPRPHDSFDMLFVHGSIKLGNIVFGVQDNAKIETEHVYLKKSSSPAFFDTWRVSDILKNTRASITFFGHSLGDTDATHFKNFFINTTLRKKINFHYHNEESYFNLYRQIGKLTGQETQRFRTQHDFKMIGPEIKMNM